MKVRGLLLLLMPVVAILVSDLPVSGSARNQDRPNTFSTALKPFPATPTGPDLAPEFATSYTPVHQADNQEQAQAKRAQEKYQQDNAPDLIDAPADIINNSWLIPRMYRWYKRYSENEGFHKDPNFKVTESYLDSLSTPYSLDNCSKLVATSSQSEYTAVLRQINEDITRERIAAAHGPFLNIVGSLLDPPKLAFIAFLIYILWLAIKGARRLCNMAMRPIRATFVFFLYLFIRGQRKASGAASSLWGEAQAVDKKVTEIERSGPD